MKVLFMYLFIYKYGLLLKSYQKNKNIFTVNIANAYKSSVSEKIKFLLGVFLYFLVI